MSVKSPLEVGGGQDGAYYVALYLCVSALLVMLAALLAYVLCSRKYQLNWYERHQLEESKRKGPVAIVTACNELAGTITDAVSAQTPSGSPYLGVGIGRHSKQSRSQSHGTIERSPSQEMGQFWLPPKIQRQASVCQSDVLDFSGDDVSLPGTPNTPISRRHSPVPPAVGVGGGGKVIAVNGIQDKSPSPGQVIRYVQPAPSQGQESLLQRSRVASMYSTLDHTKIDTALYSQQDCPMVSPDEDSKGSIHFDVSYNRDLSILCVHLIQVVDLTPREFSGTADPYAKVRLLPDLKTFRQSSIHRKTLNPSFDEDFVFDLPEGDSDQRTLEVLMYDFDEYSRHQFLGCVRLPLEGLDWAEKHVFWKAIVAGEEPCDQPDAGQLMISLGYLPSAERLTVVVMKARDIKAMDDIKKTSDVYVKVALLLEGKRLKKKKTTTQRGGLQPVFNEALTFSVSKEHLKDVSLELSVVGDNMLTQNAVLGKVVLDQRSQGSQKSDAGHLTTMIASKTAVAMWHTLEVPPVAQPATQPPQNSS